MTEEIRVWKFSEMIRSTLPLLLAMGVVGTLSGIVLNSFEDDFLAFPSTLILVPALIGVGGNLGAIFGSRLSTAVHLGILEFRFSNMVFRNNIFAIIIASVSIFLTLGIGAFVIGTSANLVTISLEVMIAISVASGGILMTVLLPLTIIVVFLSYKFGADPDDIVIPVVTTVGDVVGILALIAGIVLLL